MKTHFFTPFSIEKNLGKSYNECLSLIPEGDLACLRDLDTMFLTPDAGQIISDYASRFPDAVLVCYTNRIHPLATEQLLANAPYNSPDILEHIKIAQDKKQDLTVSECHSHLSGFLMVVPKSVWHKVKFNEGGLLGVDTLFFKDLRVKGVKILRMNAIYIFHTYRIWTDIKDKNHLQ